MGYVLQVSVVYVTFFSKQLFYIDGVFTYSHIMCFDSSWCHDSCQPGQLVVLLRSETRLTMVVSTYQIDPEYLS